MSPQFTKIIAACTAFLTILAAAPYELGNVAEVFPPEVKKWVLITGATATFILRLIGHSGTPASTPGLTVNIAPPNTQPPSASNPQIP